MAAKLAVLVGVPTVAAVLGLAIWNVRLQGEIEELRAASVSPDPAAADRASGTPDPEGRPAARTGSRREEARARALDDRLRALEERMLAASPVTSADAKASPAGDEAPSPSAELPEMLRHPDFGRAVNEVIDARETARRQERLAREAEQRTRRMLRDLVVTDAQRADVLRVTTDYLQRRDEARRALGDTDDEFDREARREAARESFQALQGEWTEALAGILDATQMETVRERATERRTDPRQRGRQRGPGAGGQR